MSVELLKTLAMVSYIVAAVLFLFAIALFFLLNIPRLFGDVTGRNARKAIENIRQQNEMSGNKAYKPSEVNLKRGKLTEKISDGNKVDDKKDTGSIGVETGKLHTEELVIKAGETTVLEQAAETTLLQQNENISCKTLVDISYVGSSEIIE